MFAAFGTGTDQLSRVAQRAVAWKLLPVTPLIKPPGWVAHTLTCRDPTSVPNHLVDVYRLVEALDLDKTLVLELKSLAQA
jgi:hypothetical protein